MSSRYKPKQAKSQSGRLAEQRESWVVCDRYKMVLYRDGEDVTEAESGEPGEDIRVVVMDGIARKPPTLVLTKMTHSELTAMKKFIDRAFALAEPICKERDEYAAKAFEEGDDAIPRIYRQIPQFVIRKRKE